MRAVFIVLLQFLVGATWAAPPELRISEVEGKKAAIEKEAPLYPITARQLKISGKVEVEAVVTETGKVEEVNILTGNPVLTKPVKAAVEKWRFRPFTSEGKPARATVSLSFEFGSR